jgi:hypothetical protein
MILKSLWKSREEIPDLTQIVKGIAANDPAEEVRKVAAGLVAVRQIQRRLDLVPQR